MTANNWLDVAAVLAVFAAVSLILMTGYPTMKRHFERTTPARAIERKHAKLAGMRACLVVSYAALFAGLCWAGYGLIGDGLLTALFRLFVTACVAPIPCVGFLHHVHDTEF